MPGTPRPSSRYIDFDDLPDELPGNDAPSAVTIKQAHLEKPLVDHAPGAKRPQTKRLGGDQDAAAQGKGAQGTAARSSQQGAAAARERQRGCTGQDHPESVHLRGSRKASSQEKGPEQWAADRLRELKEELRQLSLCEASSRRARLRALQLELHPDKQPPELRKLAQPLFLLVRQEWELSEGQQRLVATEPAPATSQDDADQSKGQHSQDRPRGRAPQDYATAGPGGGQPRYRTSAQEPQSKTELQRLFNRDGQCGKEGDLFLQVATGIGWPLARFYLPVSATIKEVKHRMQECCAVPFLKQRLQCRTTFRVLDNADSVTVVQEPRCVVFTELPYVEEFSKALLEAAWRGDPTAAERALLGQGDPNYVGAHGLTPFLVAAQQGHVEVAKVLFVVGVARDALSPSGDTPLVLACSGNHIGMVRFLCSEGLDQDGATSRGATPLTVVSSKGLSPIVRFLCKSADKDKAGPNGETPLHQAARCGHSDVVRSLCQSKADKEKAAQNGTTPLLAAVGVGHVEVVRLLCKAGADKSLEVGGYSPLHLAAAEGHLEVAQALCEAGVDRTRANEDGATPLAVALQNRRHHMIQFLS